MVPPNIQPSPLSQICQQIAFERAASEWQLRLADPCYRAFLAALFRLALIEAEDEED